MNKSRESYAGVDVQEKLLSTGLSAVHYFPTIGSTNDVALDLASSGAKDFTLVLTADQTSGRGRAKNIWHSTQEGSLTFSVIFRPDAAERQFSPLFTYLGALAVCLVARDAYAVDCLIKWPNDVLVKSKKIAGILVESSWLGADPEVFVLGIGINITPSAVPEPQGLPIPAGCLNDHTEKSVDRLDLLAQLLVSMHHWRKSMKLPIFLETVNELLAYKGADVRIVESETEVLNGKLLGVDGSGNLIIQDAHGKSIPVCHGILHLRPQDAERH